MLPRRPSRARAAEATLHKLLQAINKVYPVITRFKSNAHMGQAVRSGDRQMNLARPQFLLEIRVMAQFGDAHGGTP